MYRLYGELEQRKNNGMWLHMELCFSSVKGVGGVIIVRYSFFFYNTKQDKCANGNINSQKRPYEELYNTEDMSEICFFVLFCLVTRPRIFL